ncbi:MAG: alpha/beta hydrolase [Oscillospiraceae bacterium]|jgi:fermentation-respiration switch protein FrsA (DUF1100 family)|nr:alpha/beta hydrolase [Oscillospiraceae bacterium]
MPKRTFASLLTASAIAPMVAYFIGNKFYNLCINPDSDKTDIFNAPHNFIDRKIFDIGVGDKYERAPKRDIYATGFDGLKLHAKVLHSGSPSEKWCILCHGYGGVGVVVHKAALKFKELGYNLLIPDLRGFGETKCDYIGWGWHDRLDVASWVKVILSINEGASIVLYGVSMGAATVMAASGEEMPKNVKVVVEDSGYSSLWDEFLYQYRLLYGAPHFPVLNLASATSKLRAKYSFKEVNIVKQVSKSRLPILFIHGDRDTFVPIKMVHDLHDAAKTKKQKLIIQGARHVEALITNEKLYWDSVRRFIGNFV